MRSQGNHREQQGIQSIEVGCRLLQAFAARAQPQMLRDLAAAARMAPAKAHRYLVSLARMGLIERHPSTGLYGLGPLALELGLAALASLDPLEAAGPALLAVRRATGQTVALAVWANRGATIVRWLGPDAPVTASLRVGSVMPLTRSATGGAFLAFLPREQTERELRRELKEQARKGLKPASRTAAERWIAQTRRAGCAHSRDFIPGISGLAAPVYDHSGGMALALVALGYSKPFETRFASIRRSVLRQAAELSTRLGYR